MKFIKEKQFLDKKKKKKKINSAKSNLDNFKNQHSFFLIQFA